MAKAAELNGYPGPRHVLDLERKLNLSLETNKKVGKIYSRMHEQAVSLGGEIVEQERRLEGRFHPKVIDNGSLGKALHEIGALQAHLRSVHLETHLATTTLLSPDQVSAYNRLRRYDRTNSSHER